MFKKIAFVAVALCITGTAFGAERRFSCSNVGGTQEWTIFVDLEKKLAGFFDNDSTVVVPLKEVKELETVYVFEGRDTAGSANTNLRITFNRTLLQGGVTFDLGRPDQATEQSLDGCVADDSVVIDE